MRKHNEVHKWSIMIILIISFMSCGTVRTIYVPVESVKTIEKIMKDTIVEIKLEREFVKEKTRDTTSHIETSYAQSYAMWSNGQLTHELTTKDTKVPVEIKYVETTIRDTITKIVKTEVDRPVQRGLKWWESGFMFLGIICCAIGIVALFIKIIKR